MSLCRKHTGYLAVRLCREGKHHDFLVHRLVAEAFIMNPLQLPEVNHVDGRKTNNDRWNLEWVTSKANTQHAMLLGLRPTVASRV